MVKTLLIIGILLFLFLIGCAPQTQETEPTYSGGCGVQAENLGDDYCTIENGIRHCFVQEGF